MLGIAAAFAIAYAVSAVWSLQILGYKVTGFPLRSTFASLYRVVLASLVMAEIVWLVCRNLGGDAGREALLRVAVGTVVGVVVYVGVLLVLRGPELDEVRRRFGRSSGTVGSAP